MILESAITVLDQFWSKVMKKIIVTALLLSGLNAEIPYIVEKKCKQGNTTDCYNIALMYLRGEGVPQSTYKSSKFFKVACEKGEPKDVSMKACYELGFIYYIGNEHGLKQNYDYAVKQFSKVCDGGNSQGCYQLGLMYQNGEGVKKNVATAKEYFGKSCKLGYDDGCKDHEKLDRSR